MRAFKLNQNIFTLLGICPPSQHETLITKLFRISINLIIIAVLVISLFGSMIFIGKYITENLEDGLFAVFETIATISLLYILAVAYYSRESIIQTIEGFQLFHNRCGYFNNF